MFAAKTDMRLIQGLLATALLAGAATAQDTAPRDTGLILGSFAQAVTRTPPAVEELALLVDLSARRLYVMDGERVIRRYPVSVGAADFPTPRGQFRVSRLIWNPSWRPPPSAWARDRTPEPPGSPSNPMGRVKIFFREPDFYIHGTGHASSLGRPASHGCIRMRNADAAEVGRILMAYGQAHREEDWFEAMLVQSDTSREVTLRRGVTLRIRA
jgi:lipoprotein-anchoring transpeptidase ErfK/SrfK